MAVVGLSGAVSGRGAVSLPLMCDDVLGRGWARLHAWASCRGDACHAEFQTDVRIHGLKGTAGLRTLVV